MGTLKIVKMPDSTKNQTGKCPRCCGSLVYEFQSEFEFFTQKRCVL